MNISEPSQVDVIKYMLWCDQDGKCGYSAEPIDAHILFTNQTQIDHILPWNRTFDDSYSNKILVLAKEIEQKGDRTPYEYFGETERWNKMLDYWYAWYANKRQIEKYNNLTIKDFNEREQEFLQKNINDTRYISRYLKNYIEDNLAFAPTPKGNKQRVFVFNGKFTSIVRKSFNFEKSREENLRHHALDAVIIGIENFAINSIQKYQMIPEPWSRFAEDIYVRIFEDNPKEKLQELGILQDYGELEKYIRPLIVSRAPRRKARGQLHEETIRNIKEIINEKGEKVYYFVSKVSIENLKKEHFEKNKIYGNDPELIRVLKERLESYDWDAKKAFKEPIYKPCKEGKKPNRILKVKVIDPANSYVYLNNRGYAQRSSIVRTDVFRMNDKIYLVPVYVDQIYSRLLPNKAIVPGKPEEKWIDISNAEFLFSLYPNDYVKIFKKDSDNKLSLVTEGFYATVQRNIGAIGIIKHDHVKNTPTTTKGYFGVQSNIIKKYYVDILGNMFEVKKEKRQFPKQKSK